ncbi:interleukin-1 receptor-like 2 isoform X3 [Trachypithecus francoisi]|uniref:interleukin-1 receptor-like 2 isoform X3 n=1 Tax=Trachypithecus francoisi TaxID=54180 RepID=UPI00141A756F|nr:interleukin-1 receptor-like 2 isoform X3 [Trachypithecus francoisi]
MWSLLLCGLSIALPLSVTADGCNDIFMKNEMLSASQPFAFNCTFPPITSGEVSVTWYKNSSKIPVSKIIQSRIHQDETWILFLPMEWGDSGVYQCVIKGRDSCHRIHVNLTVFEKQWCDTSINGLPNLSDEYKQILHLGKDDSLTCHLHFPKSCVLGPIKWYKDCNEITGERFTVLETRLLVSNVSAEDGGNYACQVILTHSGKQYEVLNGITVNITERAGYGGSVPKIIYPKNNSIEVQLGTTLIVDCNITDTKDNTNLRCWRVNNTLVDDYYSESKRIREGVETHASFREHNLYTVNITFLEVKMEDYGLPFMCHAGVSAAYIMLQLPAPDFRAYLIGGLIAFLAVAVSVVYIYNIFKIDIVLWYRSAFRSTETIEAVANVIDENVKLCRRLIVIVVPESLGFGLLKNLSEEQIAVYNALIQDGMKVILIELENIEDYTAMPESIQYIKQKHGVIRWHGDFTEQSPCVKTKFWKTVRYHMPPRRCRPSPPVQLLQHTPCYRTTGERVGGHKVHHALMEGLSLRGDSQLEEDTFHPGRPL